MSSPKDRRHKWGPAWVRGGKVDDIIWLGKDTLAWCAGMYIVFSNVSNKHMTIRWCPNKTTGEGARCLSGHASIPLIAFTEVILYPKILVYTYPAMTRVATFGGDCKSGYLATGFTNGDHLLSLSSYPYFSLTVWSWRSSERLISVDTFIRDAVGQVLRINRNGELIAAQMGRTCGKLYLWNIDILENIAVIKDHKVTLHQDRQPYSIDWSPTSKEPMAAVADKDGNVHLCNRDGTETHRIVLNKRCSVCIDHELPFVAWFREGIALRTNYCQIQFFAQNRTNGTWHKEWFVKSVTRPCILVVHPSINDRLFYHTHEGYLMQIHFPEDSKTPRIEKYLEYGGIYRFIDFVYPWTSHLVTVEKPHDLVVIDLDSGTILSRLTLDLNGAVTSQSSNTVYPLIAMTSSRGEVVVVSLAEPKIPLVVSYKRLHEKPLDISKFSLHGRFLLVGHKLSGVCYCMSLLESGNPYRVVAHLSVKRRFLDALVFEEQHSLKVVILVTTLCHYVVGNELVVFHVPRSGDMRIEDPYAILCISCLLRYIHYVPGESQLVLGTPYITRYIIVFKLENWKNVVLREELLSGHHTRCVSIHVDQARVVTTSFDGLTIIREKSLGRIRVIVMSHHRMNLGACKAITSSSAETTVALGFDGSLVAMKIYPDDIMGEQYMFSVEQIIREKRQRLTSSDFNAFPGDVLQLLQRRRSSSYGASAKTWIDKMCEKQLQNEAKACMVEKAAILRDFATLKEKLSYLLNENDVCSDLERLPLSVFDLDKVGRDQKLKFAKDEREDVRMRLEHTCAEMDRVSQWIKTNFCNMKEISGQSIFSFGGTREVTNYPNYPSQPFEQEQLDWTHFNREAVHKVVVSDTFIVWKEYTDSQLDLHLNKALSLNHEDERHRIETLLQEEEDINETERNILAKQGTFEGLTSYRYIEQSPYLYNQIEMYGYNHLIGERNCLITDSRKLREYFNKLFREMYTAKEREMTVIQERNDRIRYIDNELRTMFNDCVANVPEDPKWHIKEKPENILTVFLDEVNAKPYISPSMQEILDRQAAEAERIRLLMMADDFRDRALMQMMDGVLEVRWEDIIKLDIPKPQCMIDKIPEKYTPEDILVVERYEKDLIHLEEERERYKRILEAEYVKTLESLKDKFEKFDAKLDEFFKVRMQVESALHQITLRLIRGYVRIFQRNESLRMDDMTSVTINEMSDYSLSLTNHLHTFLEIRGELANELESLIAREKPFAKKIKSEFYMLGKVMVELLERQYKRRPRQTMKDVKHVDIHELTKHIVARTRPAYIASECLDYLKQLDALDNRPGTLSANIEPLHWEQLTRLRRQRIDLELKIKAKEGSIVETDRFIRQFRDKMERCDAYIMSLRKEQKELRDARVLSDQNVELQLVMKMGQIEIDLYGRLDDASNAILIPRSEVEKVNKWILAAGAFKVDAMQGLINFRRGTLYEEWVHACMRKRLTEEGEDLHWLKKVSLTREIQNCLKRKAMNLKDEKTAQQIEREWNTIRDHLEKRLRESTKRLESVRSRIEEMKKNNAQLDRKIVKLNVVRCEMELSRDLARETREYEYTERKINIIMKRSRLMKKLQEQYAENLTLQTEYELLRLRKFPDLQFFRILDE